MSSISNKDKMIALFGQDGRRLYGPRFSIIETPIFGFMIRDYNHLKSWTSPPTFDLILAIPPDFAQLHRVNGLTCYTAIRHYHVSAHLRVYCRRDKSFHYVRRFGKNDRFYSICLHAAVVLPLEQRLAVVCSAFNRFILEAEKEGEIL